MKKCRKCLEVRDETDFYKGSYICKECKKKSRNTKLSHKRGVVTHYLGTKCTVCGNIGTTSHEIHGTPHKNLLHTEDDELISNCLSGRFSKVCYSCHQKAHAIAEYLYYPRGGHNWELIVYFIRTYLTIDDYSYCNGCIHRNPYNAYFCKNCYRRINFWKKFLKEHLQLPSRTLVTNG